MKAVAPLLLLLAACASSAPRGAPAMATLYGDIPRLQPCEAFLVEGAHTHAAAPDAPCLSIEIDRLLPSIKDETGKPTPRPAMPGFCALGDTLGGPDRLVLVLLTTAGEAVAVDVPRLAPGETERTFLAGDARVSLERPVGARKASIDRGRVTVRRLREDRYDVELFAVLKPEAGSQTPMQVIARVETSTGPRR